MMIRNRKLDTHIIIIGIYIFAYLFIYLNKFDLNLKL